MPDEKPYQQHASAEEISFDKTQLTETVSNAYTISPELFEKLYLTPKVPHTGDAIKRYANATPLGFVGFVISTMTFSMVLMGWGGAGEEYTLAGMFLFVGPLLLTLTTIFEWIMGNFFPMMVCGLFSVFWLSFGLLQLPTLNFQAAYAPAGTSTADAAAAGAASVQYNAALAIYMVVWGFAIFTFFIFTLKMNTVFALMFLSVTTGSWVLSGAFWKVASGDYVMAGHLQKVRCYY
jgi:uncharacterized protein